LHLTAASGNHCNRTRLKLDVVALPAVVYSTAAAAAGWAYCVEASVVRRRVRLRGRAKRHGVLRGRPLFNRPAVHHCASFAAFRIAVGLRGKATNAVSPGIFLGPALWGIM
jgi:hypothetical protein